MMKFVILPVTALVVLVLCVRQFIYPNADYADIVVAYRLTADIEMAGQTYSGSGVVETRWRHKSLYWLDESGEWGPVVQGQAVGVDMGRSGAVVITLSREMGQMPPLLPSHVYGLQDKTDKTFPDYLRRLAGIAEPKQIPSRLWPEIIYFTDAADPNSAECIQPSAPALSDGDASLPHITRMTIQMVREPPTRGIEHILPWLEAPDRELAEQFRGYWLHPTGKSGVSRCKLRPEDFKHGM